MEKIVANIEFIIEVDLETPFRKEQTKKAYQLAQKYFPKKASITKEGYLQHKQVNAVETIQVNVNVNLNIENIARLEKKFNGKHTGYYQPVTFRIGNEPLSIEEKNGKLYSKNLKEYILNN